MLGIWQTFSAVAFEAALGVLIASCIGLAYLDGMRSDESYAFLAACQNGMLEQHKNGKETVSNERMCNYNGPRGRWGTPHGVPPDIQNSKIDRLAFVSCAVACIDHLHTNPFPRHRKKWQGWGIKLPSFCPEKTGLQSIIQSQPLHPLSNAAETFDEVNYA